jgi:hypothetical protein
MSKVRYISSSAEIPSGQNYVLVIYGEEYGQMRNSLGLTITVARNKFKTINDLSFLTAVHSAKEIAKREGISTIFACKYLHGLSPACYCNPTMRRTRKIPRTLANNCPIAANDPHFSVWRGFIFRTA